METRDFIKMKKEDVVKYLDQLVDGYISYTDGCNEMWNCRIFIHHNYSIHVDNHIQILAAAVGKELNHQERDSSHFKYAHSFEYKGVELFQNDNNEKLPEVVWDEN